MHAIAYCGLFIFVVSGIVYGQNADEEESASSCYTQDGRPIRCSPPFVNAAYGLTINATNTCGMPVSFDPSGRPYTQAKLDSFRKFFVQTGAQGSRTYQDYCNNSDANTAKRHPAKNMVDLDATHNTTWWQSITLYEYNERNLGDTLKATIMLHLGKAFDITYIRIKFHSPRPESFVIYKKTSSEENSPWIPYQFFSASCRQTYSLPQNGIIDHPTRAICTGEFSDVTPLSGGNVAFGTLQDRPGAYNFENDLVLQEFVTATDIKIELTRLNTFGDEVFEDDEVLQSYYFAISDISVGARCKCNGHASECVKSSGVGESERLVCLCQHHTAGPDCGSCSPFHNNKRWAPATINSANACEQCNCNGRSERCYFDQDLFIKTGGNGGHCLDCRDFTDGPNCEQCQENYHRHDVRDVCMPCNCDETGSLSLQCDDNGQCMCKPGVTGLKCDRCEANYYDFGTYGCRECRCSTAGSFENTPSCDSRTGQCACKEYVEGQNCDRCKPGYFNLDASSRFGCIACFCNGKTASCSSANGYVRAFIGSYFDSGDESWRGVSSDGTSYRTAFNGITEDLAVAATSAQEVYFMSPQRFLGDQKFSYNQFLEFNLRIGEDVGRPSQRDIILEGNGRQVYIPIFAQNNSAPGLRSHQYKFRLNEHPKYQWSPRLSALEFQRLLANLTAIKIRGTYNTNGRGFIDNIRLTTAHNGQQIGDLMSVEQCVCPSQYIGQFCESCAPGFRRERPFGGPSSDCVPCSCNGHSQTCDAESGACICLHNTTGHNCEKCKDGFYGNALSGTSGDCRACPCPGQGPCYEQLDKTVSCLSCPQGYGGDLCDQCVDDFYGDPKGHYGNQSECQRCDCNGNVDSNAVGNCNTTSGVCRKCIYNTGGLHCEQCLAGFYGNALADEKGDCKACLCNLFGTTPSSLAECRQTDGQCSCLPYVTGRQCDRCEEGYYNLESADGCEACLCDPIGSTSTLCNLTSGQCSCKPGVGGLRCNVCIANYYGFSEDGCKPCHCASVGSAHGQCDESGQCVCKDESRITGLQCDQCRENKHNMTAGCVDCPACYNLVQDAVNDIRGGLVKLAETLKNINENPDPNSDLDFTKQLQAVADDLDKLHQQAEDLQNSGGPVSNDLQAIIDGLGSLKKTANDITNSIESSALKYSNMQISSLNDTISMVKKEIDGAYADFRVQSQALYQKIYDALNAYGQKSANMTLLAQRSTDLADKHIADSDLAVKTADEAHTTSENAFKLAQSVVASPADLKTKLSTLNEKLKSADKMVKDVGDLAKKAKENASRSYDSALENFQNAENIAVSQTNTEMQLEEAQAIVDDAEKQKKLAVELEAQYLEQWNDSRVQLQKAELTYQMAYNEQQVTDKLMAEVDVALEIASKAVNDAENMLNNAQNRLKTLQEFDQRVQDHKDLATEAMKKIPEIEAVLAQADNVTAEAARAVGGARNAATEAEAIALEAQAVAGNASQIAASILSEARQTMESAFLKSNKTDHLGLDLEGFAANVSRLETKGQLEGDLIQVTLTEADKARKMAAEVATRLILAEEKVADIIDKLANTQPLNTSELERLEAEFALLEGLYNSSDITRQMDELGKFRTLQAGMANVFVSQLNQLMAEVSNIGMIAATIPENCYNPPVLERPAEGRRLRKRLRKL